MNPGEIPPRYLELAEKWLNGTITPEEEKEYNDWYNSIEPGERLHVPAEFAMSRHEHRNKLLNQINKNRTGSHRLKQRAFIRVAAAAIIILVCGTIYWVTRPTATTPALTATSSKTKANDIAPGTSGAILRLSGGQTILLDTATNGSVAQTGLANVLKSNGSVSFIATNDNNQNVNASNTLATPRGRQFQLVLADGTAVWLNASSSITFPTLFTGNLREVSITGEAYFEVAQNPQQPFIVHTGDASVEVLGTHFNIMAYNNEPALETSLLEGAVKLKFKDQLLKLKPGQQGRIFASNDLKLVEDADIELAVAWKNGLQAFSKADLKTIMRQVERWYDVDVAFAPNIPARTFTGEIPREVNLSELLKLFEATDIHFLIDAEKKKLTITP
jgi:transmembrane sensor